MNIFMKIAEPVFGALYSRTYHQNRLDVLLQERRGMTVPVLHMHKAVRVTAGGPYDHVRKTRLVNKEGLFESYGSSIEKGWTRPGDILVLTSWHQLGFAADDFVERARAYGYNDVRPGDDARLNAGEALLLKPRFPEQKAMLTVDDMLARRLNGAGFRRCDDLGCEEHPVCVGDALVITTDDDVGTTQLHVFSAAYAAERLRPVALN